VHYCVSDRKHWQKGYHALSRVVVVHALRVAAAAATPVVSAAALPPPPPQPPARRHGRPRSPGLRLRRRGGGPSAGTAAPAAAQASPKTQTRGSLGPRVPGPSPCSTTSSSRRRRPGPQRRRNRTAACQRQVPKVPPHMPNQHLPMPLAPAQPP
jgi:hypothetical protein